MLGVEASEVSSIWDIEKELILEGHCLNGTGTMPSLFKVLI